MRSALVCGFVLALTACDDCGRSATPREEGAAPAASIPEAVEQTATLDAGRRTQDAEPGVDVSAHLGDASVPDPACGAPELDLASAIVDARCAVTGTVARKEREAIEKQGPIPLRQEAKLGADGRIVLRVVNTGPKPLAIPLSWHPKLAAFTALAETADHVVYELEAPKLEPPGSPPDKARFARVTVAPGAAVIARVSVPTTIVKRIAPACPDGGTCAPAKLPAGKYTLHLGELVVDVEAGAPARVDWVLP